MSRRIITGISAIVLCITFFSITFPRHAEAKSGTKTYLRGTETVPVDYRTKIPGEAPAQFTKEPKNDTVISYEVTMALQSYGTYIFVHTENGRVELTGYVLNIEDVPTIERLAAGIEGVTEVIVFLEAPRWQYE